MAKAADGWILACAPVIEFNYKPVLNELIRKVDEAIYTPVAPFSMLGWLTPEPVDFAARESGRAFAPRLGETWSERLFDCAWLRFRAELPPGAATGDPLVARIDISGELCLVDAAGVPVRGLTTIKSTYDPRLGSPGKTIYRLPPALAAQRTVEIWGDAGCNDLFGNVQNGGRVVLAEVARCREDLRDLFYDLETLRHYRESGAVPGGLAAQLEANLAGVARTLDCQDRASVAAARQQLAPWFRSSAKPPLRVSAVGHAHMDLAWLWPIRETIRKGARTFSSVLYNLERFPEYIFGASQPQLYAWMKAYYPELYARIKQAVARGQIEPQGVFWVEVDCNIPTGESFVRQILHGARFFREEFGVEPRYCWEPDVFGYHGQLPQILKRSGLDVFMTQKISWNVVNRFPLQSFQWAGIDGTEILAHLLPEETYNGPASAYSLKKIGEEYAQKDVSRHALMVFGIGDGGGGPDAEHLERLRRAPGLPGLPAVVIEPATEFFRRFMPEAGRFPRHQGELYLERHQGTLTTQARMKRFNRQGERALREVEWACFLASLHAGRAYPTEELDRVWKEVLLYQFHDILPGSSIKRVYDECYIRYAQILARLAALQAEAYQALPGSGGAGAPVVFNSLAWARDEWLKRDGAWRRIRVPAFGSAAWPAAASDLGAVHADAAGLENERLKVTFAADGAIASIRDRQSGREFVAAGETVNQFVAIPDVGDAWDFETDYERKDVWKYLARPVTRPTLVCTSATVDGPCAAVVQEWTVGRSRIWQTISLHAGSDRLDFTTQVDWQDTACMLRVRFPVAVVADEATFEIPFGHIRRSTREETLVQRAQVEVAAQQWVDLSQPDAGVALLNDCKYGHRVKGHTLDLCLIRSVPHPNINTAGRLTGSDVPRDEFTDLGAHEFRYALLPHAGPLDPVRITRAARCFNVPLEFGAQAGSAAVLAPALRLSHEAIELVALKPAETGAGWALRLTNVSADPVETGLTLAFGEGNVTECDLMERPLGASAHAQGDIRVGFSGFEIKTFVWRPRP